MKFVKITRADRNERLTVGYTYQLEKVDAWDYRLSSIGGKFSIVIDPAADCVAWEEVDAPVPATPLKGWRNSYAADLWVKVFTGEVSDPDVNLDSAARTADTAVALFKERWEGDTFTHNLEQAS